MKSYCMTCLLTAAVLSLTACSEAFPSGQEGSLSVVIDGGKVTKVSDTGELDYEQAVRDVQIFLFAGASLYSYEKVDTRSRPLPYVRTYTGVHAGSYKVHVVANGPDLSGVATEAELLGHDVQLSDCRLDAASGFVMAGSAAAAVGESEVRVPLAVQRFAARVRLVSIENQVPAAYADGGAVTVKGVFLVNALGSWNLAGSGTASEWVNLGGRTAGRPAATERSDFLFAAGQVHPAAYRAQVFRSESQGIARGTRQTFDDCCLYTFPNAVTSDNTGNTATESAGAFTRLVVLASVDGADWWYPVTLFKDGKGPQRNTTYDVKLTLRATGSTDPNEPVGAGSLTAAVSAKGWLSGVKYTETL